MPKKYHRPPTVKRRKARRSTIPYEFERPDEHAAPPSDLDDDGSEPPLVAVDISPDVEDVARSEAPRRGERHLGKDYSYVFGDIVRIGAIAGFLIVSLIITSIFR